MRENRKHSYTKFLVIKCSFLKFCRVDVDRFKLMKYYNCVVLARWNKNYWNTIQNNYYTLGHTNYLNQFYKFFIFSNCFIIIILLFKLYFSRTATSIFNFIFFGHLYVINTTIFVCNLRNIRLKLWKTK